MHTRIPQNLYPRTAIHLRRYHGDLQFIWSFHSGSLNKVTNIIDRKSSAYQIPGNTPL